MIILHALGISPDSLSYPIQFIVQFLLGIIFLTMLGNFQRRTFAGFVLGFGGLLALILENNIVLTSPDYKLIWTLALDGGFATALFFLWMSAFDWSMRRHILSRGVHHALLWLVIIESSLLFWYDNEVFLNWFILSHIVFATIVLAMISTMLWQKALLSKVLEFWEKLQMLIGFLKNT